MLTDPQLIKRILVQDFSIFRNRVSPGGVLQQLTSKSLLGSRNEEWKRIRAILNPVFTIHKLRKMEYMMANCTTVMIASFEQRIANEGGQFRVKDAMGAFSMDVIAKCAFATDTNAHTDGKFIAKAKEVLNFNIIRLSIMSLMPPTLIKLCLYLKLRPIYVKSVDFFLDLASHLIRERKGEQKKNGVVKHHDMMQLMVNAEYSVQNLQPAYKEEDFNNDANNAHHLNDGMLPGIRDYRTRSQLQYYFF